MVGKSLARQEYEAAKAAPAVERESAIYRKVFDLQAHDYALLGATNNEIADLLGVDVSSIDRWIVEIPSFAKALKRARVHANIRVVKSLYHAARGYRHRETKVFQHEGKLQTIDIVRHHPPNVNAAALVLSNRASKHWQDRRTVDHQGKIDLAHLVQSSMGDDAKVIEAKPVEDDASE